MYIGGKEMSRFKNHLKKELININKNLYINPSDSLYYEKIIRYTDPHSPEAHYRLGQKHDRNGSLSKALFHYNEAASHSDSQYYSKAKSSIKKIEDKLKDNQSEKNVQPPKRKGRNPLFVKSIITFLIMFNLILLFILFGMDPMRATVSNMKQWNNGMNVIYESSDVPYVIYFPTNIPNDEIEEALYHKAVLFEVNPDEVKNL
jgi:ATP-dependent Zn protease